MSDSLIFSRSLYAEDAVRAAADAYGNLAKFEVVAHDADIELRVSDIDAEFGPGLLDEIANHALYETVQHVRSREDAR